MCILAAGCLHVGSRLNGYYYEGRLPAWITADIVSANKLASDLSAETGLIITSKSSSNVFLNSSDKHGAKFNVNIAFYTPKNSLYIAVRGDIASSEALAATQKAVDLFTKDFPGAKLTTMTVYPGLLGP